MQWCRIYFRLYFLLLFFLYFTMLYVFYNNLQYLGNGARIQTTHQLNRPLVTKNNQKEAHLEKSCYLDASVSDRTFLALTSVDFIYSAYLDERYEESIIRLMAILSVLRVENKNIKVLCHFTNRNGTAVQQTATIYEMCENHERLMGGYILSCDVPSTVSDICYLNVSAEIKTNETEFSSQGTFTIQVQVTLLNTNLTRPSQYSMMNRFAIDSKQTVAMTKYTYAICVPPLFGEIDVDRLIEFIELNRILGFEHFIFYLADLENPDILKVLQYYRNSGIVTTIDWNLPDVVEDVIYYNAQLTVHNDCMYRAISLTQYLAIIDIDEFIVPHDEHNFLPDSLSPLFHENVAGLSFDSAFYDPKYAEGNSESKLLSMKHNGRSSVFSEVRTKVLVQPAKVFEIGIHHVSKPAKEEYQILKVNTSTAFLHHYRVCTTNFGMNCTYYIRDDTLLKFSRNLEANFAQVLQALD